MMISIETIIIIKIIIILIIILIKIIIIMIIMTRCEATDLAKSIVETRLLLNSGKK